MGVVALVRLVFHMGRGDGDAAFLFFGGLVDLVVRDEAALALETGDLGDGRREGGLAVVDVADGADVHMRLLAFVFRFAHLTSPWKKIAVSVPLRRRRQGNDVCRVTRGAARPNLSLFPGKRIGGESGSGNPAGMERETGFEPATLSLEG